MTGAVAVNTVIQCISGSTSEVGISIEDGSLNNYFRLSAIYVSAGIYKVIKTVRSGGGAPAVTDLITNIPDSMIGLRIGTTGAETLYCYSWRGMYIANIFGSGQAKFFNAARIGFFFAKTGTGATRDVNIVRWTASFT